MNERPNPFKTQQWGQKKFVPKVPNRPKTERVPTESATPWKKFKDQLLEKQREEDTSNAIDMDSAEAKEMLKKREQNYRRMLIKDQAKQPTKWENFEDTPAEEATSSRKKPNLFIQNLEKTVGSPNFDSKKLNFKQNNTLRKIITKGITQSHGNLRKTILDIKRKKRINKMKKEQSR